LLIRHSKYRAMLSKIHSFRLLFLKLMVPIVYLLLLCPDFLRSVLKFHSLEVSSVVPVFKDSSERSVPKNYHPISLLSVISRFSNLLSTFTQYLESNNPTSFRSPVMVFIYKLRSYYGIIILST